MVQKILISLMDFIFQFGIKIFIYITKLFRQHIHSIIYSGNCLHYMC